ncbi:hypothetical protein GCM10009789_65830 [Kribbella sancticallisti]|uniref:Uncharacterized protein n=1 Tax=Kribbella sancticallisti TaxID=460087 RepID=A0ABN2EBQ0_9ACTN
MGIAARLGGLIWDEPKTKKKRKKSKRKAKGKGGKSEPDEGAAGLQISV